MVPVAGRLGVTAAAEPAVGLVAFLFGPAAAETGRLAGAADAGLVFAATGFAVGVEAEGFVLTCTEHKPGTNEIKNGRNTCNTNTKRK